MTEHSRNIAPDATFAAIGRGLSAILDAAERHPDGKRMIGEAFCAGLDTVAGGAPLHTAFGDMRSDAEWWADCATPLELEAYAAAALRRIERRTFAERARKRLFMALWGSFTDEQRARFLAAQEKPP